MSFDGKLVIVTGAAQGIGHAIAQAFSDAGARLHLLDIDADGLVDSATALRASHHLVDLGDREAVHKVVAEIEAELGAIAVLASAAGGVCDQTGGPIGQVSEQNWRRIFAANVDTAFWLAQAVAPSMMVRGNGRIIYIASSAGLRPSLTGIQAYTAAKHALVGLTRQLSWEFASSGVTVNAVAPGLILSNPTTVRQWEGYGADGQRRLVENIHSKRLGCAEDVAAAVLFFASEAAGWISGQILSVDGGRS